MRRRNKALGLFDRFIRELHEVDKDEPENDADECVAEPDQDQETDPDDYDEPNHVGPAWCYLLEFAEQMGPEFVAVVERCHTCPGRGSRRFEQN